MHNFADRVHKLRKAYGLSQEKFAQRLGISRDYLSQLENGRSPGKHVEKIIELFESASINQVSKTEPGSRVEEPSQEEYRKKRIECENHLREYLDRTSLVPGAVDHALIQLRLHLPLSDADKLFQAETPPPNTDPK